MKPSSAQDASLFEVLPFKGYMCPRNVRGGTRSVQQAVRVGCECRGALSSLRRRNPDVKEEFEYILPISPIHNVRKPTGKDDSSQQYPAILITTGAILLKLPFLSGYHFSQMHHPSHFSSQHYPAILITTGATCAPPLISRSAAVSNSLPRAWQELRL